MKIFYNQYTTKTLEVNKIKIVIKVFIKAAASSVLVHFLETGFKIASKAFKTSLYNLRSTQTVRTVIKTGLINHSVQAEALCLFSRKPNEHIIIFSGIHI